MENEKHSIVLVTFGAVVLSLNKDDKTLISNPGKKVLQATVPQLSVLSMEDYSSIVPRQ